MLFQADLETNADDSFSSEPNQPDNFKLYLIKDGNFSIFLSLLYKHKNPIKRRTYKVNYRIASLLEIKHYLGEDIELTGPETLEMIKEEYLKEFINFLFVNAALLLDIIALILYFLLRNIILKIT